MMEIQDVQAPLNRHQSGVPRSANRLPHVVWSARPDGTVDYCSDQLCNAGDASSALTAIRGLNPVVHREDAERTLLAWDHAVRTGEPYEMAHRLKRAGGNYRWYLSWAVPVRDEDGKIIRWYGSTTDIDKQKRAEERTVALQVITSALSAALTPAQVGEIVVGEARRVMGAEGGVLCVRSEDGNEVQLVQSVNYPDEIVERLSRFSVEDRAPLADAVRTGRAILFRNPEEWAAAYSPAPLVVRGIGHHAAAAIPMRIGEKVVGVIGLTFGAAREFSRDDLAFMEAIAAQTGQALERARLYEAEQQASEAKDQFVALVSHELRNQLNAIASALRLLRQSCQSEGTAPRAIEILERNARLQARLVNDLLDLTRLKRGRLRFQRSTVALDEIIAAACQAFENDARDAGVHFTYDIQPGLWVQGDGDRLQQVVTNLVLNAVKFTPPGGTISLKTVKCSPRDTEARLSFASIVVEDTGIGLEPSQIDHLFDMFYQGNVAGHRKSGLGIGLALVKGIIELHRGSVRVESAGPGKGSRFIIELPLTEQ